MGRTERLQQCNRPSCVEPSWPLFGPEPKKQSWWFAWLLFVIAWLLLSVAAFADSDQHAGTFSTDGAVEIRVRGTYEVWSITGSGRCVFKPPMGHEYLVGGDAVITIQSMLGRGCGEEAHLTCRTPVQLEFVYLGGSSEHPLGDFDHDGDTDLTDFAMFQVHFGLGGLTHGYNRVFDEVNQDEEYVIGATRDDGRESSVGGLNGQVGEMADPGVYASPPERGVGSSPALSGKALFSELEMVVGGYSMEEEAEKVELSRRRTKPWWLLPGKGVE